MSCTCNQPLLPTGFTMLMLVETKCFMVMIYAAPLPILKVFFFLVISKSAYAWICTGMTHMTLKTILHLHTLRATFKPIKLVSVWKLCIFVLKAAHFLVQPTREVWQFCEKQTCCVQKTHFFGWHHHLCKKAQIYFWALWEGSIIWFACKSCVTNNIFAP